MILYEYPAKGVRNAGARQGFINRATSSKNSATKGDNKGRPHTFRSGCPECPIRPTADNPDGITYVSLMAHQKMATCKHGHVFSVGRAPGKGPK